LAPEGGEDGAAASQGDGSPLARKRPLLRIGYRLGLVPSTYDNDANWQRFEDACEKVGHEAGVGSAAVRETLCDYCGVSEGERPATCLEKPACNECDLGPACPFAHRRPTIKQLPETERPRERLIQGQRLTEAELLAILIRAGTRDDTAIDLGRRLLREFGDLRALSAKGVAELCRVKGIGPAKAAQIKAAFQLTERLAEYTFPVGAQFIGSRQVYEHYHARLRDKKQETFMCLLLDVKNRLIREEEISVGGLNVSVVEPRDVFAPAVRESASAVLFVHNHPSGDPTPSPEDVSITKRLKQVGELMGFRVLDHVITGAKIGPDGRPYYSFVDDNRL